MPKQTTTPVEYKSLFLEKIKQNYQSLVLGFIVFLVGLSVVMKLVSQPQKLGSTKKTDNSKEEKIENQINEYKVKEGDTLWSIAESYFGSGFNAFDIASANKITNPDLINKDQEIIIPNVTPKQSTKGVIAEAKTKKVVITESKYKVKTGDYLWKIALEAYGDGYQWVKIAKTNNLSYPDIIHAGNVLTIPR